MKTRILDLLIIILAVVAILLVIAVRADDRPRLTWRELIPTRSLPLVVTQDRRIMALEGVSWRWISIPQEGDTLTFLALVPSE